MCVVKIVFYSFQSQTNAFASDLSGLYLCRRFEIVNSFLVELAFNVPNSKPRDDIQIHRIVSVAVSRQQWEM